MNRLQQKIFKTQFFLFYFNIIIIYNVSESNTPCMSHHIIVLFKFKLIAIFFLNMQQSYTKVEKSIY